MTTLISLRQLGSLLLLITTGTLSHLWNRKNKYFEPHQAERCLLTIVMLNKLDVTPTSNFQLIRLLDPGCWYKFTYCMTYSADPDQLASSELIWIYTVCKGRVYPGSAGCKLRIHWSSCVSVSFIRTFVCVVHSAEFNDSSGHLRRDCEC